MYCEEKQVAYSAVGCNKKLAPSAVLNYFQDIAIDNSAEVGCSIKDLEKKNLAWLVISTRFKAYRYPEYRENIKLFTWPKKFYKIFGERGYEIYDSAGEKIIKGSALWLLFNREKGSAVMVSDDIKNRYITSDREILPVLRRDIKMPQSLKSVKEIVVEKRDLDSNFHVNNVKYVEFAAELLPDNEEIEEFEVFYRHAAKLGDKLVLSAGEEMGYTCCEIKNSNGVVCVTMRFKIREEIN